MKTEIKISHDKSRIHLIPETNFETATFDLILENIEKNLIYVNFETDINVFGGKKDSVIILTIVPK
jgi:hypothetical protein